MRQQRPSQQSAVACGYSQRWSHSPQLAGSVCRSKPSSTTSLQLSSRPLQISGTQPPQSGSSETSVSPSQSLSKRSVQSVSVSDGFSTLHGYSQPSSRN